MWQSLIPIAAEAVKSGINAGPAGPSGAASDNVFDSGAWTVATGGSRAGEALDPWIVGAGIAAAALVLLAWVKRKG